MKRTKQLRPCKEFPQEFELEDLIERIISEKEKGLQQVNSGKTIPHEKVKAMTKNGKNSLD